MRIRTSSSTTKIAVLGLAGRWDGTVILSTHRLSERCNALPRARFRSGGYSEGQRDELRGHARGQAPGVASIDQAKDNGRLSGYTRNRDKRRNHYKQRQPKVGPSPMLME
jgi:hypothetical protein